MNDSSVHPITSVRPSVAGAYNTISSVDRDEVGFVRENPSTDTNQLKHKTDVRSDFTRNLANISIHFNVDDETNHLVVVVTERNSGRVIRTIPASELENMQAGDLLKLAI